MKLISKALLIAVLILGGHFTANAQIGVGGRVGVNLAKVAGEDDDTDSKIGLDIAAVLSVPISETFTVQPEIHFLQKGGKEEGVGNGDIKTSLNYLEIPILGKYSFGGESVSFFLLAGPSFGFGLGYKIKDDSDEISGGFDELDLKSLDISVDLGAGVTIPLESGQVFIDLRYLLGITDISDSGLGGEIKSRGINFGLGFLTNIGG